MRTEIQPVKLAALVIMFMLYPILLMFSVSHTLEGTSAESIGYILTDKSNLHISLTTVNPGIHTLAADESNGLVLKVRVSDSSGAGVPGAGVKLEASNEAGSFAPSTGVADASGNFLSVYTPPEAIHNGSVYTDLSSHLSGTDKSSTLQIKLIPVPVVLIHGYQASPAIFSGLSEYLKLQGYMPLIFSYASENGVAASAALLSIDLQKKEADLEASGIQVSRFDLIAHSMGGLVARYYTCSSEYAVRSDVRKLIFISVPQKGSPFASLGMQYFEDSGIQDLVPDSALYTILLPSMINAGLNPSIQTGSLLGKFDEVVGTESASLDEWKIETELFDLGDSNFTFDKLLSGELLQAANHKMILYNKKVYERIQQMLESQIPYPTINQQPHNR